jgi:hypothetical protein
VRSLQSRGAIVRRRLRQLRRAARDLTSCSVFVWKWRKGCGARCERWGLVRGSWGAWIGNRPVSDHGTSLAGSAQVARRPTIAPAVCVGDGERQGAWQPGPERGPASCPYDFLALSSPRSLGRRLQSSARGMSHEL